MNAMRTGVLLSASVLAYQQAPTFKSAVDYVEINAVVTTKAGAFVRDLTRGDFVVMENGKQQTLSAFSFVDLPRDFPASTSAQTSSVGASPTPSSEGTDRRAYLIVLDVMHVDPTRTPLLRERARDFINEYFGPRDLGAVALTGYPGAGQDFTADRAALVSAVEHSIGEKTGSAAVANANADPDMVAVGAASDRDVRVRQYMAERSVFELAALVDALGAKKVPRKALVLFSEGLDVEYDSATSEVAAQVHRLYTAAARANVTIYTVDPRGISDIGDDLIQVHGLRPGAVPPSTALYHEQRVAQSSLRNFAEETGGLAWVGSGDFARGFRQIVDDNSTYYVLGYYSGDSRQDGKYRSISVRVNRKGVSVRARKGYYAASPIRH